LSNPSPWDTAVEDLPYRPTLELTVSGFVIHEEIIKSRLNSRNDGYYAVQNLPSFYVLSKKADIKIYITIVLPTVSVVQWV
jgi:hypothetical protein